MKQPLGSRASWCVWSTSAGVQPRRSGLPSLIQEEAREPHPFSLVPALNPVRAHLAAHLAHPDELIVSERASVLKFWRERALALRADSFVPFIFGCVETSRLRPWELFVTWRSGEQCVRCPHVLTCCFSPPWLRVSR